MDSNKFLQSVKAGKVIKSGSKVPQSGPQPAKCHKVAKVSLPKLVSVCMEIGVRIFEHPLSSSRFVVVYLGNGRSEDLS